MRFMRYLAQYPGILNHGALTGGVPYAAGMIDLRKLQL